MIQSKSYTELINTPNMQSQNCMAQSCLSADVLDEHIEGIRGLKIKNWYGGVNQKQSKDYSERMDELHKEWNVIYERNLAQGQSQPFKSSFLRLFRLQMWGSLFFLAVGILCHSLTPYVLYIIYQNILSKTVHSDQNKLMIIVVVIFRLLRVFCCYYSDTKLNKTGLKMYQLVTIIATTKTLKCSPLTNKNIQSATLTKMMHTDCFNIITYPARVGFMVEMAIDHIVLPAIGIYVAGIPGAIGIGLLFAAIGFRFLFKRLLSEGERAINRLSSDRIKATIQTFNIIKLIKVNSLQSCYFNRLRQLRKAEVVELRFKVLLEMIQNTTIAITKPLIMILVAKLLVMQRGELQPEVLFTFSLVFSFTNIQAIVNSFNYVDIIVNSFANIEQFMAHKQLELKHITQVSEPTSNVSIQITDGNFEWDPEIKKQVSNNIDSNKQKTQQKQSGQLKNINITINKGEFVAIVGGYGSGKTSLVQSLVGQMNKVGNPQIRVNGTIAYASQIPWIMNDTIKNNILFGLPYDQKRYKEAIKYSSLQTDLQLFNNGDLSMIGKRGSTLSGGQKARVSFARALYANSDIYILDDILSAVDAHVGSFLFFMGIKQYLKGKTVLLITHALHFVAYTDRVIMLQSGEIVNNGSYSNVSRDSMFKQVQTAKDKTPSEYEQVIRKGVKITKEADAVMPAELVEEEISIYEAFKVYIRRNSGLLFVIVISLFVLVIGCLSTYSQINLNNWAFSTSSVGNSYLYISLIINTVKVILTLMMARVLYVSRLFQSIHDDMIRNLLFSPYSYFQRVPTAKIINRLSNDLATNDKIITSQFGYLLINLQLLLSFVLGIFYVYLLINNYWLIAFVLIFVVITYCFFKRYFLLSMQINKLEQQFIIPINSKFSEILDGLVSIRGFAKVQFMMAEFKRKLQIFASTNIVKSVIDSRIKFILLFSANLLAILQALTLIFMHQGFKSNSIFLIFNFFSMQDGVVRVYNSLAAFAPRLQSLGKCEELTNLQPQQGYVNYLQKNWVQDEEFKEVVCQEQVFSKGEIVFENYCFRYKPELQDVLKGISLVIKPGQKVGIVGRTGSGKSTMLLGLLRIVQAYSGKIIIDGRDISTLSLEQLRSNINIILQEHFLFTGTVKSNIDPTQTFSDQQIINALQLCGIWQKFMNMQGLNTPITQGGDNLSSGEKQLINIARSLLNPKPIVLIDEATASIDLETDTLIQKVLKKQFAQRTVLTIAHRINTVVDSDRILVLDQGLVSEFDSPANLLKNEKSLFAKLFQESGKKKSQ